MAQDNKQPSVDLWSSVAKDVEKAKQLTAKQLGGAKLAAGGVTVAGNITEKGNLAGVQRMQTFSKWQKYGWAPSTERDNDFIYNNADSSENWQRATKGALQLAKLGFTDNALFGAFADKNSAKSFEDVMKNYSSNQGGIGGFAQNLLLSGGYTLGITADMVAEELAMAAVEIGSVGLASEVALPGMALKGAQYTKNLAKAFNSFKDLRKVVNATDNVADISKLAKAGKAIGNFVNPFENTTKLYKSFKTVDNLKDINTAAVGVKYAGAIFRDVKAAHMTYSEAKLEGDMAKNDIISNRLYNNKNLSDSERAQIIKDAEQAGKWTKLLNLPVIGLTNKIAFDNVYKSLDAIKGYKSYNLGKDVISIINGQAKVVPRTGIKGWGARNFGAFSNGFMPGVKQLAKNTGSTVAKYGVSNLGEGIQELGQEITSGATKNYYGTKEHGTMFNALAESIKENALSVQGGETFLSGFLMGGMIHPFVAGLQAVPSTVLNKNTYTKVFKPKEYKASREERKKLLEQDANLINEAFKQSYNVFDNRKATSYASQLSHESGMVNAALNNDKGKFHDSQAMSFRDHMHAVMRNDAMDEFVNSINKFKDMNDEQFKTAFPMSDFKDSSERMQAIDKQIATARNFEKHYKNIQKNIINPFEAVLKSMKPDINNPEYQKNVYMSSMFNNAKDNLIFRHAEFDNNLNRMEDIMNSTHKDAASTGVSYLDYATLFDTKSVKSEISNLRNELTNIPKDALDTDGNNIHTQKSKKLKALERFNESITEFHDLQKTIDEFNNTEHPNKKKFEKERKKLEKHVQMNYDRLFGRHNEYIQVVSTTDRDNLKYMLKDTFSKLWDYHTLSANNKSVQKDINVLMDPKGIYDYVSKAFDNVNNIEQQRKDAIKNSMEIDRDTEDLSEVVNVLHNQGVTFDLKDGDKLMESNTIPQLYDLSTNEPLDETDPRYAEAMDNIQEFIEGRLSEPENESDVQEVVQPQEFIVDVDTPISEYPKSLLTTLINKYKEAVENGEVRDKDLGELSLDNLSQKFFDWVNDNGQPYVDAYNKTLESSATSVYDSLSLGDRHKLLKLGYDKDMISGMSLTDVDNVITNKIKPEDFKSDVSIDEVLNLIGINDEESNGESESEGEDGDTEDFSTEDSSSEAEIIAHGSEEEVLALLESKAPQSELPAKLIEYVSPEEEPVTEDVDFEDVTDDVEEPSIDIDPFDIALDESLSDDQRQAMDLLRIVHNEVLPGRAIYVRMAQHIKDAVLPNIGMSYKGILITPSLLDAMLQEFEIYDTGSKKTTELLKHQVQIAVSRYNNDAITKAAVKAKAEVNKKLLSLGYVQSDIQNLSTAEIDRIIAEDISKNNREESIKSAKDKEVEVKRRHVDLTNLSSAIKSANSMSEMNDAVSEFMLNNESNDNAIHSLTLSRINELKQERINELKNLRDFKDVKENDVILLQGVYCKVIAKGKDTVTVVNYNSNVLNERTLTSEEFNNTVDGIVNEFNKGNVQFAVDIKAEDINQLLNNLSNFTNHALMSKDNVNADDILEHFNNCKL